jgi:serine/threonine-protein kinase
MPIQPGQKLSHYELVAKIGEGGMGEVWKALDTRLDREVAVKFLPDTVTRDQDRMDRFAREAKFLASLNHPGIATIHDIDEDQGVRFLVMELVPGLDLAELLESGPMPLDDALDTALQIARAFEAAHGQGVVHRDLKPANVKRSPDGQIKVLDFGLAKVMGPEPSSDAGVSMSPTMTSAGTIAGVILGTAAYMSPEQARGRPVDKRTDIWSFGVLLYELLTGDNPFRGNTVADSVGAIMHRDPDLEALPPGTPTAIRRLLRRCLTRERDQRLHDIADARIELEEAIADPEVDEPAAAADRVAAPPSKLPWVALAVLVPLAALIAWWIGSRPGTATIPPLGQFKLVPDEEVADVVLSPDGSRVAYKVGNRVFIRALDSLESRAINDGSDPIGAIFWSPDGESLGLALLSGDLQRIDLDGSAPTTLASLDGFARFPNWSDDGYIYFAAFRLGIHRLPESGGASEAVLAPHPDMLDYHGMDVLPGGRGILTLAHLATGEPRKILLEKPGEEPRVVFESDSIIRRVEYSTTGHLCYQREDNPRGLWAVPFSLERLEVTGAPFLVLAGLDVASFSERGDMAYAQTSVQTNKRRQQIVWADRSGTIVERLDIDLYDSAAPTISPDGSRLALFARGVGRPSAGKQNLWVIDLDRKSSSRLTEEGVPASVLEWSADGSRIAFLKEEIAIGGNGKILAVRADGTGEPETVLEADIVFFADLNEDWSVAAMMTGSVNGENGLGISVQDPSDPSTLALVVDGPGQEVGPAIHPSGRWVAYLAGELLTLDVYVQPFPTGEGRWKTSIESAAFPLRWSADGTRLYWDGRGQGESGLRLMEVEFDGSGAVPVLGKPVELFYAKEAIDRFSIGADGRFVYVMNQEIPEGEEPVDTKGIVLVQNWLSRFEH